MNESENPLCETCAERGRERPGVHPVGSGYLCDPCWRGEGTREERALGEISESVRKARRLYREKNRERLAQYQRDYRERKLATRAGNQVLHEAGTATVTAAAAP